VCLEVVLGSQTGGFSPHMEHVNIMCCCHALSTAAVVACTVFLLVHLLAPGALVLCLLMKWSSLLLTPLQVPLMFACIFKPELVLGDMGAVVYVAVFWILSGYVNTCAYLVSE
jgi:hypothetical protein